VFGYVCVDASQLKMWEYELYKSTYCAICRHGGKHTTKLSRFFLSYDFVALALMRMMLTEETPKVKKYFCPYSPKRKNMLQPNPSIEYTADAFMILAYYKIVDDKNDSFGFKKICKSIPLFLLRKKAMQAEKRNPTLSEAVRFELNRLSKAEREKCSLVDRVADCFAMLLAKTLSIGLEGDKKIVAHEIGYHVGRYIYIIDALDDYKKDLKTGNYNPLKEMFPDVDILKENLNSIKDTLIGSMNTALSALNLLEDNQYKGVIENILTYGSYKTTDKVLKSF
jgi:hypothetical protein